MVKSISIIWPYSCWFCRMCWAYVDWGLLFLMYLICSWKHMFRLGLFVLHMIGRMCSILADKFPIYCGRNIVALRGSDDFGYGNSASESSPNICVFEYVWNVAYLWGNVCENCPSLVLFVLVCSVECFVLCFIWCPNIRNILST